MSCIFLLQGRYPDTQKHPHLTHCRQVIYRQNYWRAFSCFGLFVKCSDWLMIVCVAAVLAQMDNKLTLTFVTKFAVCIMCREATTRSGMLMMSNFMPNINQ